MTVGYYHVELGSDIHSALLAVMLKSVRASMPGVPIVHLPTIDGPLALSCLRAYAAVEGEWLFLDTDTVVQQDVRHVFDDTSFDVAVADREGTLRSYELGRKFMDLMPHNKGAVFSRCSAFWRAAVERCLALKARKQEWMGDQLAMNEVILSGAFKVKVLPSSFNYAPRNRWDEWHDKAIVHFKGTDRKPWMLRGVA